MAVFRVSNDTTRFASSFIVVGAACSCTIHTSLVVVGCVLVCVLVCARICVFVHMFVRV